MKSAPPKTPNIKATIDGKPLADFRTTATQQMTGKDELMRSYMAEAEMASAMAEGQGKPWARSAAKWILGPIYLAGLLFFPYRCIMFVLEGHFYMATMFAGFSVFFALLSFALLGSSKK